MSNLDLLILLLGAALSSKHQEQNRLLDQLRQDCAKYAYFDSYLQERRRRCFLGTRIELLNRIREWSRNADGKYIFWLHGMAGTGKSTIALTVAHDLKEDKRLGASFFFQIGQNDLSSCEKFITSLAVNLADNLPFLKPHICDALDKNPEIATNPLPDQWTRLILEPLKSSPQSPTVILVIDALDECKGKDDIELILQFLEKGKDFYSYGLRVLVTSRPRNPIRSGSGTFGNLSKDVYEEFSLHDIDDESIKHDISIFFEQELKNIRDKRQGKEDVPPDWPGKERMDRLIEKADKLFIYAETACRFIQASPPGRLRLSSAVLRVDHRLSLILEGKKDIGTPTSNLDQLYNNILNSSFPKVNQEEEEGLKQDFKSIVGSIAILFDPLSTTSLAKLLGVRKSDVECMLEPLFAVLDVPLSQNSPVRLLHPSFRDFLLNRDRSADFWVDEKKAHHDLAMSCLRLMPPNLKRDICGLGAPGFLTGEVKGHLVQQRLPLDLQYACRFWVQHLQCSKVKADDYKEVYTFLQKHLLHWLEALSLIGKTSEGIFAITLLEHIIEVSAKPW